MECIYCGSPTSVGNSRLQRHGNHIWRRRKCADCGSIFTTREYTALDESIMVERNHSKLEPFSRDRLFVSIYESCKHRPQAITEATALTQTTINQLMRAHHQGKLSPDAIAHHAHIVLKRFDPVAATFYAAYHAVAQRQATTS